MMKNSFLLITAAAAAGSNMANMTNMSTTTNYNPAVVINSSPVHGFRLRSTATAPAVPPAQSQQNQMQVATTKAITKEEVITKVKARLHKEIDTRVKGWLLKELQELLQNEKLAALKTFLTTNNIELEKVLPAIIDIVFGIVEKKGEGLLDAIAAKVNVETWVNSLENLTNLDDAITNFINTELTKVLGTKTEALKKMLKDVLANLPTTGAELEPLLIKKVEDFVHTQIDTRLKSHLRNLLQKILATILKNNGEQGKQINPALGEAIVNAVADAIEKQADDAIEKIVKLVSKALNLKSLDLKQLADFVAEAQKGSIVKTVEAVLEKYLGEKVEAKIKEFVDSLGKKTSNCFSAVLKKLSSKLKCGCCNEAESEQPNSTE